MSDETTVLECLREHHEMINAICALWPIAKDGDALFRSMVYHAAALVYAEKEIADGTFDADRKTATMFLRFYGRAKSDLCTLRQRVLEEWEPSDAVLDAFDDMLTVLNEQVSTVFGMCSTTSVRED
jgi:hypothetical protein